jgi:isopentenyl diphosphate isomerase/L-lactate dehydrogenase-like FMN-dependent dehydrogenase
MIRTGKAANAVQAAKHLNSVIDSTVSVQTIRNVLKEDGLKAYVKKKKPLLTTRHKKARLQFAQKYSEWTVEDWKRVIWSDETKINRFGSDGLQYVWKKPGEPLSEREITSTVKFGGGNIMVWGCMG